MTEGLKRGRNAAAALADGYGRREAEAVSGRHVPSTGVRSESSPSRSIFVCTRRHWRDGDGRVDVTGLDIARQIIGGFPVCRAPSAG